MSHCSLPQQNLAMIDDLQNFSEGNNPDYMKADGNSKKECTSFGFSCWSELSNFSGSSQGSSVKIALKEMSRGKFIAAEDL